MQYIFLDESGNVHKNSKDLYFVIGGIITDDYYKIKRNYKRVNKKIKEELHRNIFDEIKANQIKEHHKKDIIFNLQKEENYYIIAVVVSKNRLRKKIENVNAFYNYIVKLLLEYLIDEHIIDTSEGINCLVNIDKRTIKVGELNTLDTYLKIHFNYEKNYDNVNITVNYLDSKDNYMIQLADVLCNIIWTQYSYPETDNVSSIIDKKKMKVRVFP